MPTLDNLHKIDAPYWARPGFTSFAKADDGGGRDDDEDTDDDDDDDEEDDDEDDLADLTEDELKAELRKTRESLSKASGSSKSKRDRIKQLRAELDEAKRGGSGKGEKKDDKGNEDKPDIDAIRRAALDEGRKAGEVTVKRSKVEVALAAAGVVDDKARARLARMVDLDDLDLDDKGNVDGLDEVIDELKGDMPSLFEKRRKRPGVGGASDEGGKSREKEDSKLSASERQARMATRSR